MKTQKISFFIFLFSFFFFSFSSMTEAGVEEEWRAGWREAVQDSEEAADGGGCGGGWGKTEKKDDGGGLLWGMGTSTILIILFSIGVFIQIIIPDGLENWPIKGYYALGLAGFIFMVGWDTPAVLSTVFMLGAHRLHMTSPSTGSGWARKVFLEGSRLCGDYVIWPVSVILALLALAYPMIPPLWDKLKWLVKLLD